MSWGWLLLIWAAFSAYLALFFGLVGAAYVYILTLLQHAQKPLPQWAASFIFPSLWILAEWARSLGIIGDPGGALGYSQAFVTPILQGAAWVGVFGLSFFCTWINTLGFYTLKSKTPLGRLRGMLAIGLILGLAWFFGSYRLYLHNPKTVKVVPVTIIQGNFSQKEKMNRDSASIIRQSLVNQTHAALTPTSSETDYVFWPEVITPTFNLDHWAFVIQVMQLAKNHRMTLLFGTPLAEQNKFYNAVVAMTPEGLFKESYKKVKLMPFGEYWPLESVFIHFESLRHVLGQGYTSAPSVEVLRLPKHTLGIGICLESVYPWYFRSSTQKGADFLAVALNNGWFLDSFAADEHFQMSIFRAVENNRYLVLAGNTGISGVITQKGQPLTVSTLNTATVLKSQVLTGFSPSFYTQWGDWIVYVACGFILLTILLTLPRLKSRPVNSQHG